jgi:hypothetical protein
MVRQKTNPHLKLQGSVLSWVYLNVPTLTDWQTVFLDGHRYLYNRVFRQILVWQRATESKKNCKLIDAMITPRQNAYLTPPSKLHGCPYPSLHLLRNLLVLTHSERQKTIILIYIKCLRFSHNHVTGDPDRHSFHLCRIGSVS